jgi:hypothetical protein
MRKKIVQTFQKFFERDVKPRRFLAASYVFFESLKLNLLGFFAPGIFQTFQKF